LKALVTAKDFENLPYDRVKQANAVKKPPLYKSDPKYSRSQQLFFCNTDGDTGFELLENGKKTGKCCRCGKKF